MMLWLQVTVALAKPEGLFIRMHNIKQALT
jgi:hypothetical protein